MPPFDFSEFARPDIIEEVLRRLHQQAEQPAEQPAEPKPERTAEPVDAKDEINERILSQTRPRATSLPELYAQQGILQSKSLYENAQNIANAMADQYYGAQRNAQDPAQMAYVNQLTQATQQQSNEMANNIRAQMGAAGVDMSQYGSDVSLEDASRRYAEQQMSELMQAITGQYSLSAEEYYDTEFDRQILNGASARNARRRAAKAARKYQADRVGYLNNLYNAYGRDGRVTNELGNQILTWMSQDNPGIASYYAQIYPNARDAYARENKLQDDATRQQSELAQLAFAEQNARERMQLQAQINDMLNANNTARGDKSYTYRKGVDEQYQIGEETRAEDRAIRAEQRKIEARYNQILSDIQFYKTLVPDADIDEVEVIRAALGWKNSGGKDKSSAQTLNTAYKNMIDAKQKQINSIIEQYKDVPGGIPKNAQDEITELRNQQEQYLQSAEIVMGLRDPDVMLIFKNTFSGTQINELLSRAWEITGGDTNNFQAMVEDIISKSPINETKKKEIRSIASVYTMNERKPHPNQR